MDGRSVAYYKVRSEAGGGTHVLRVLSPTEPAPDVPHNFLYVLPVEPELGTTYGDGLETMRALNAESRYNLTIVEPSFGNDPWYADNSKPDEPLRDIPDEDLVPWAGTGRGCGWRWRRSTERALSLASRSRPDLLLGTVDQLPHENHLLR